MEPDPQFYHSNYYQVRNPQFLTSKITCFSHQLVIIYGIDNETGHNGYEQHILQIYLSDINHIYENLKVILTEP